MDNQKLFCVIDGETTSQAFPVPYDSRRTFIGELKDTIKAITSPTFDDIPARDLTLWADSIPVRGDGTYLVELKAEISKKTKRSRGRHDSDSFPRKLLPNQMVSDMCGILDDMRVIRCIVQGPIKSKSFGNHARP
ncbi:hypothetical protein BGZ46_005265 [Entomortierella lignicola]|nr:hypothetical protein BGZ46_005265 [Entomortierella lignicola]